MRCFDAVVSFSRIPSVGTLVTHAVFVPGVGSDVHILSDRGCDDESVLGAVGATVCEGAWVILVCVVVEHEEVILRPVSDILREISLAEGVVVV
mgnify:CR=1 FL=1